MAQTLKYSGKISIFSLEGKNPFPIQAQWPTTTETSQKTDIAQAFNNQLSKIAPNLEKIWWST